MYICDVMSLQQENIYDCGVFACFNSDFFAGGSNYISLKHTLTKQGISLHRRYCRLEIIKGLDNICLFTVI